MYFLIVLKVALKSLWANKLRSFLAVLGVIIGVGAVIAMLAIGAGTKNEVVGRLKSMGTDLLMIRPGQRGMGGVRSEARRNLKKEDAEAILAEIPNVLAVAPVVQGRCQVKYYENNSAINVLGTVSTYFRARNYELDRGRLFTDNEAEGMARVAIIGPTTVKNLMVQDEPLGATIKVKGLNFKVIGITKPKGDQGWFDPDDQVIIPYTTAMQQVLGTDHFNEVDVQGVSGADLTKIQDDITELLRRRHRLQPEDDNDFNIGNQAEILETLSTVTRALTILLGSVGAISLIVGGIGIMNIMLVTVTERTREIGVRKAIGAKDRDILRQFLFEAMFMSCLGGLIGVFSGIGVAKTIGAFTQFSTFIQPQSVIIAMTFAAAVGIFFGYYPAYRAARLNPIDALRYE
ncbi:MAG TPA: ABC transporter permease [Candidatus Hydrogenedentes bacterium]|nr:ABC transporter permease [Candidatus Hydrogenedentota bacterium]